MDHILVFGSTGLLGWYITTFFLNKKYKVTKITRSKYNIKENDISKLTNIITDSNPQYIINCTNSYKGTFEEQIYINSLFPQQLSKICENNTIKFIHISTNGVFYGIDGNYNENDVPDAKDAYGITKYLGENTNSIIIRTSIIGEQVIKNNTQQCIYLLDWLISSKNKNIIGYTNHIWNGVTCLELAKYIYYIIINNITRNGVRHFNSSTNISKYDLICIINNIYKLNLTISKDYNNIKKLDLYSTYNINYMVSTIESQIHEQRLFTLVNRKPKGIFTELTHCRFCNTETCDILHLGDNFGLAGGFLCSLDETELENDKIYPLTLSLCNNCKYMQCKQVISSDELFKKNYFYYSSMISSLAIHFKELASWIYNKYPNKLNKIIEIGCNDGVLLHPLKDIGYSNLIGVDPSQTIKSISTDIVTYNDYFNEIIVDNILEKYGLQDIFISCNSFAHINDMNSIIKNIQKILKPETGIAIIEVHNSINIFTEKNFDFIYHEHMGYYTVTSLYNICKNNNISLIDVEFIKNHGGSLRCTIKMAPNIENDIINKIIVEEQNIFNYIFLNNYRIELFKWRNEFKDLICNLQKTNKVFGYGASGRANTIMNFCEIELDGIIDDSPSKIGCYTPIYNVHIYSNDILYTKCAPDYCVILAWPYSEYIIQKHKHYSGKFIIPLPYIKM